MPIKLAQNQPATPKDWERIAAAGLTAATTAKDAQRLLMDLTTMPQRSFVPAMEQRENLIWRATAQTLAAGSGPNAIPAGALGPRLRALVAYGADPIVGKSLHRATHRKDIEMARVFLDMPNGPRPSQTSGAGASALHRAVYAGPDALFDLLASRAEPADWTRKDKDGRTPLEKAFMSRRIGRATRAADFTTPDLEADAKGDTFFHRVALFINSLSEEEQPKWIPLFVKLLSKTAEANLTALNAKGETLATMAGGSGLTGALAEQAILLLGAQAAGPAPARGPRARL